MKKVLLTIGGPGEFEDELPQLLDEPADLELSLPNKVPWNLFLRTRTEVEKTVLVFLQFVAKCGHWGAVPISEWVSFAESRPDEVRDLDNLRRFAIVDGGNVTPTRHLQETYRAACERYAKLPKLKTFHSSDPNHPMWDPEETQPRSLHNRQPVRA